MTKPTRKQPNIKHGDVIEFIEHEGCKLFLKHRDEDGWVATDTRSGMVHDWTPEQLRQNTDMAYRVLGNIFNVIELES